MLRACSECGRVFPQGQGSRCERCRTPQRWDGGSTRQWRQTRQRILERDGHQCTAIINGQRCQVIRPLEIHHLRLGTDKVVPDDQLITVCPKHHRRGVNHAM